MIRHEDLKHQGYNDNDRRHQVTIETADELRDFPHGCDVGGNIQRIGDQQQQDDAHEHARRERGLDVGGKALAGDPPDLRAHGLDRGHQRVGQWHRPQHVEAELGARLRIGGNAARVVIGHAGDETRTKPRQGMLFQPLPYQAKRARAPGPLVAFYGELHGTSICFNEKQGQISWTNAISTGRFHRRRIPAEHKLGCRTLIMRGRGPRRGGRRRSAAGQGFLGENRRGASMTEQRLPKQGRRQIIEEEQQLRSSTDVTSRCAVERHNGFDGDLPGDGDIRQAGVHRGDRFRSPRAVDRKLDQRHQLVERLVLWRTARELAGQIQRAEFDRKTPMQDVNYVSASGQAGH